MCIYACKNIYKYIYIYIHISIYTDKSSLKADREAWGRGEWSSLATILFHSVTRGFTWTRFISLGLTSSHLVPLGLTRSHLDSCGFT